MSQTPTGLREDQTPDTGAENFVKDMLRERFGDLLDGDVDDLPDYVIPLGILGGLDWIAICGWWAWTYTGIYHSSETYKWVYQYSSYDEELGRRIVYEFDPDRIMKFREDDDENAFEERFNDPGLTDKERSEAVQFLIQDVYEAMDREPPDPLLVEIILYCTFMWVLSDNGREWLCEIDPVWNCVDDFGVAFLEQWENMLLDPRNMECTEREIGECVFCRESVHCVSGASLNEDWFMICNDCLCTAVEEGHQADLTDNRIVEPLCPFRGGRCLNTECPHNPITDDMVVEAMQSAGSDRLDRWRTARVEANEPRRLAGRTVEEIIDYFK
tara:strand:- start:1432 stop:2415 length:984 start_codon:yes stop_codon:yes gene_type:complete